LNWDGVYKRIADVPVSSGSLFSRRGSILIGQAYHPVTFYSGEPMRYAWADGKYSVAEEYPLPPGVGLYGFAFADFGEAKPFLVALDEQDQLRVYSGGAPVWRSEEKYPAAGIIVTKPVTGIDAVLSMTADSDKTLKVKITGRVSALDLNGDGRDEILLPKNGGKTFFSGFKKAEFIGLGWTGARLEHHWNIKDIPGAVFDYYIIREQGVDAQVLALVMTPGGLFARDTYRVVNYSVK
jgi:hypothetical protein